MTSVTQYLFSFSIGAIQVQQLGVEMQGTILIGFAVEDVAKKMCGNLLEKVVAYRRLCSIDISFFSCWFDISSSEHHFGFDELPFVVLCKPKESSRRIIRFSGDNFTRESLIKFIEDHELGIFVCIFNVVWRCSY